MVSSAQETHNTPSLQHKAVSPHASPQTGQKNSQPLRPQQKRRMWLKVSFIFVVFIPFLLGAFYYSLWASDRYVSGAGFAVRGVNAGSGLDAVGALTGLASTGSTTSDSYIILEYLKSRDLLEKLQKDLDLRKAFTSRNIDFFSRMDEDLTIEEFVTYWRTMVSTSFDSTSGVLRFEVQGFTAEDAQHIAQKALFYIQELVNQLSETARQDSVKFANQEVSRAETRLRKALLQLRDFREKEQSLNPTASAQMHMELLGNLERQLVEIRARMAAISSSVSQDAPTMVALRRQAEAIEAQIATRTAGMTGKVSKTDAGAALSELLATYETLEVEKNFAQKAYESSLSFLEKARIEADRQQRYLAVYSNPALSEEPQYPRRLWMLFLLFTGLSCLWGVGVLVVYAIRDHLS